jgi:hypothetical protein
MPQIKQAIIQSIYNELDNKIFSLSDFKVEFPESGRTLVKITFLHDPKYYFAILESQQKSSNVIAAMASALDTSTVPSTIECPGEFKLVESSFYDSFSSCVDKIGRWCQNVRKDIMANTPVIKEFEELQKKLEEHLNSHGEIPEEPISASEIESIKEKFDSMYAQFEQLKEKHEITQEQLKSIKEDFEVIKNNSHGYSKKMWVGLTKSRLISIAKKIASSPEGRKLMYEGAKKLLLGPDVP